MGTPFADLDLNPIEYGVTGQNALADDNFDDIEAAFNLLKENAIVMLASVVVNLQNGDGKTTVYTVLAGYKFIPTHVIIRNPSASLAGGTSFSIGDGANADTWKTGIDLSAMTASTDCIVITNDNVKFTEFDAADVFGIKPVTGATADATATMEVFGKLRAV